MSSSGSTHLPGFQCVSCDEDITGFALAIEVAGDKVCLACFDEGVRPMFESALVNEENYPPSVGATKLEIVDYADVLPAELVAKYTAKSKEYDTLPKDRVFCAGEPTCNTFVGKATKKEKFKACDVCTSLTCLKCRKLFEGLHIGMYVLEHQHTCEPYRDAEDWKNHMFPEDTRGKDWQFCPGPGCHAMIVLQDGCNHVRCSIPACRTEFCFVCGEQAFDHSGHWRSGKPCPRYGHPSSARRMFDNLPELGHPGVAFDPDPQVLVQRLGGLVQGLQQDRLTLEAMNAEIAEFVEAELPGLREQAQHQNMHGVGLNEVDGQVGEENAHPWDTPLPAAREDMFVVWQDLAPRNGEFWDLHLQANQRIMGGDGQNDETGGIAAVGQENEEPGVTAPGMAEDEAVRAAENQDAEETEEGHTRRVLEIGRLVEHALRRQDLAQPPFAQGDQIARLRQLSELPFRIADAPVRAAIGEQDEQGDEDVPTLQINPGNGLIARRFRQILPVPATEALHERDPMAALGLTFPQPPVAQQTAEMPGTNEPTVEDVVADMG